MGFVYILCKNWLNYSVCVFVCCVTVQATRDRGASRRPHCYRGDVNTTGMGLTVEAALCGKLHVRCLCVVHCCSSKHNRVRRVKQSSWIINTLISKYFCVDKMTEVSISMRRLIIHTFIVMGKLHSSEESVYISSELVCSQSVWSSWSVLELFGFLTGCYVGEIPSNWLLEVNVCSVCVWAFSNGVVKSWRYTAGFVFFFVCRFCLKDFCSSFSFWGFGQLNWASLYSGHWSWIY